MTQIYRNVMTTTAIELQTPKVDAVDDSDQQRGIFDCSTEPQASSNEFSSLPPVDAGKEAWLFLAACWGVEAVTFGNFESTQYHTQLFLMRS